MYRARDTRLGRDVAIKILPRAFKDDPDRLARFEREARVLASLNHPHIGVIYGLEESDGLRALVMEVVEGEDLAAESRAGQSPSARPCPSRRRSPKLVTRDGSVVGSDVAPDTGSDIVRFPLSGLMGRPALGAPPVPGTRDLEPLVRTPFSEAGAEISPDMRYLAYQSNESGPNEIYVRPFPHVNNGRWQVSTGGGLRPVWSRDGRELFYLDAANTLTAVPVQTSGTTLAWANPVRLFRLDESLLSSYDVSRDGQRFLMIKKNAAEGQDAAPPRMVVVLNFFEELKRLAPAK